MGGRRPRILLLVVGVVLAGGLLWVIPSNEVQEAPDCRATAEGIELRRRIGWEQDQGDPEVFKPGFEYSSHSGCLPGESI